MMSFLRTAPAILMLGALVLAGCRSAVEMPDPVDPVPDVAYAMRWWNVLNAPQMVAALYGDTATGAQAAAAKMYAELDAETKKKVNAAAAEIYGEGGHASVGAWWETLDCRLMRVAAGDGNTADPMSAFCAHYPGSGHATILGAEEKAFVDVVGTALLGRMDIGDYPPLNPPQWIHGTWLVGCAPENPVPITWQFSEHQIVFASGDESLDSRMVEKTPQATLSEEHGATWYRFDYQLPIPTGDGVTLAHGWNRFDMTVDPTRVAWTGNLSTTPIPMCRLDSQ